MNITDVRVKLADKSDRRLLGFASVTIDDEFVIREMRIVCHESRHFVAMPSRQITRRCDCGEKNFLRSRYCHICGISLSQQYKEKTYTDVAHPITHACRMNIERVVLSAYLAELEQSKLSGYVCMYDRYDYNQQRTSA